MARGGKRTPRNPAPVSGPGALARRTDGGPGQPVRSFPAEYQGQRQGLANLQAAAPMSAGPSGGPAQTPPPPSGPGAAFPDGAFGATQRPTEPITQGLPGGDLARDFGGDVDYALRVMYQLYPHPELARLINLQSP